MVWGFWKAQVAVSVVAGILAGIQTAIAQQTPLQMAAWSIAIAVGGYFAALAIFAIFAIMIAPVTLDGQRAKAIANLSAANSNLEALSNRKHPADAYTENKVRELIADFSEDERSFLRWLHHSGTQFENRFSASGVSREGISGALTKGRQRGLILNTGHQPRGLGVASYVNERYLDALRELLY